jgi:hypothetical protein
MGNVVGIAVVEAPLPVTVTAARFDLPLPAADLFAGDFGAVVFAIILSLETLWRKRA